MGGDSKEVQTQQSSVTNPYAPTQPLLQSILNSVGGINMGVSAGQSGALSNLKDAAGTIPNFGGQGTDAVNKAFNFNVDPQVGMLNDSYQKYIDRLSGTASGKELDPYSTPGFGDSLNTLTNDITNKVNSVYAGSGRDPSGAGTFSKSLGRGLIEGEAPVIQAQYNQNKANQMDAASKLFSAGGATAGGLTQEQLAALNAQFQGITGASSIPGLLTQPGMTQLGVANTEYNQPLQNIGGVEGLVNPIAGLGGQTNSSGTQNTTTSKSLASNIMGGVTGGVGLLGQTGAFGSAGWLTPALMAFSDENLKENIHEVGATHDGQPLYLYNYIGDEEPRVGLMAQDVEKRDPGAVHEIAGFKAVDYGRALAKSREIGGWLGELQEAA